MDEAFLCSLLLFDIEDSTRTERKGLAEELKDVARSRRVEGDFHCVRCIQASICPSRACRKIDSVSDSLKSLPILCQLDLLNLPVIVLQ